MQISLATADYPRMALLPNLESQHGDLDHPKKLINCSLYHCRAKLKISSNTLIVCWLMTGFRLGSQHIDPDHYQNLILVSFTTPDPSTKFHCNPFIKFWVMLLTEKQTNQLHQKYNLLCQGDNEHYYDHDVISMKCNVQTKVIPFLASHL